ncbi:hypothetical protein B0H19DRAFT_1237480 [Mycena capillaripes]|nr:hypothetical protein B0H19DRAFT_1237480 [Mycena capillaripes]
MAKKHSLWRYKPLDGSVEFSQVDLLPWRYKCAHKAVSRMSKNKKPARHCKSQAVYYERGRGVRGKAGQACSQNTCCQCTEPAAGPTIEEEIRWSGRRGWQCKWGQERVGKDGGGGEPKRAYSGKRAASVRSQQWGPKLRQRCVEVERKDWLWEWVNPGAGSMLERRERRAGKGEWVGSQNARCERVEPAVGSKIEDEMWSCGKGRGWWGAKMRAHSAPKASAGVQNRGRAGAGLRKRIGSANERILQQEPVGKGPGGQGAKTAQTRGRDGVGVSQEIGGANERIRQQERVTKGRGGPGAKTRAARAWGQRSGPKSRQRWGRDKRRDWPCELANSGSGSSQGKAGVGPEPGQPALAVDRFEGISSRFHMRRTLSTRLHNGRDPRRRGGPRRARWQKERVMQAGTNNLIYPNLR